jgi:hypothetical protein
VLSVFALIASFLGAIGFNFDVKNFSSFNLRKCMFINFFIFSFLYHFILLIAGIMCLNISTIVEGFTLTREIVQFGSKNLPSNKSELTDEITSAERVKIFGVGFVVVAVFLFILLVITGIRMGVNVLARV